MTHRPHESEYEPAPATSETAVPETARPESATPESATVASAVAEPPANPGIADPGVADLGVAESGIAEPEITDSEIAESGTSAPGRAVPESVEPETAGAADPLAPTLEVIRRLQARLRNQVLGRDEVVDLVLVALLADGHVLLEDYPGSGKTTLAKTLGLSIDDPRAMADADADGDDEARIAAFRRIQFTPDLLPSDVTGVSVFDANTSRFHFRPGPLFAHVVLADEINRTSPKVQSAMLEAMAEKQVTVDNRTHRLDRLFFVIATQNPLDLAGTYPLPAPQLDRFLFKIRMDHIERDAELRVLDTYRERRDLEQGDLPRVGRDDLIAARRAVEDHVTIDPAIKACLVDLSRNLRLDERVLQGNSTRSLVLMLPALQALAAVRGRDYVSADDVRVLAPRVLGHRVELAPGVAELDDVIRDAMAAPLEELARRTLKRR